MTACAVLFLYVKDICFKHKNSHFNTWTIAEFSVSAECEQTNELQAKFSHVRGIVGEESNLRKREAMVLKIDKEKRRNGA